MATRPTKDWQDRPSVATPVDAAALEDADARGFDYTEDVVDEHNAATSVHGIPDTSVLADATDVSDAVSAHSADTTSVHGIADTANLQPLDSDLTAIAALSTTSFGRSLLTLADAAAAQSAISAQPVDSDLTAIAALTTTSYVGRLGAGLGSYALDATTKCADCMKQKVPDATLRLDSAR